MLRVASYAKFSRNEFEQSSRPPNCWIAWQLPHQNGWSVNLHFIAVHPKWMFLPTVQFGNIHKNLGNCFTEIVVRDIRNAGLAYISNTTREEPADTIQHSCAVQIYQKKHLRFYFNLVSYLFKSLILTLRRSWETEQWVYLTSRQ